MNVMDKGSQVQDESKKTGIKAIVLLSGGLDSAIAARLMQDQGIELVALNFHSPFCTCASNMKYNGCSALIFANKMNIPIKMLSKGDDYLGIVQHPKFGYGKHMNPCIDCRIYLFRKAMELMPELGALFIVTGKVLGQRPKSQMQHALQVIDRESGAEGYVVRPLSARLLLPTIPEQQGWVDRSKLLSIKGRRRNLQVQLGKDYNLIKQYCASGGCLLTDANFANKLVDYFAHESSPKMADIPCLKVGRHFRYNGVKVIVGRNEKENAQIEMLAKPGDCLVMARDIVGPTTLVQFSTIPGVDSIVQEQIDAIISWASNVTIHYSDSVTKKGIATIRYKDGDFFEVNVDFNPVFDFESFRLE